MEVCGKGLQSEFRYDQEIMKKNLLLAILLAGALCGCNGRTTSECESTCKENMTGTDNDNITDMNNISNEDLSGIRKALDLYVAAAVEGDSNVAKSAFAENATMSHAENDSLVCLPIKALYDYYDATGKHPASYEISECSVAGDVAMVRIESVFGDTKFTDMFALVKEGKDWKIVSKIFHVK